MLEVLAAIQTAFQANTGLTAVLPNLYNGQAPEGTAMPYAIIIPMPNGIMQYGFKAALTGIETGMYAVDVYAIGATNSLTIAKAFDTAFNGSNLAVSDGAWLSMLRTAPIPSVFDKFDQNNKAIFCSPIMYRIMYQQG